MDAASPSTAIRRLATAQAISFAGGTSAYVALTASIYAQTGSASWVATVIVASFAVPSLASPLTGALGDRYDRRWVMIVSDALGVVCFLGLALLSAPGLLVALKTVASLAAAPFFPAAAAAVPRLVSPNDLPKANATVSSWGTAGTLIGPIVGGALTGLAGASVVFVFNAVTFAGSAFLIRSIKGDFRPRAVEGDLSRGFSAGIRFLASDPVLRGLTVGVALLFVGTGTTLPAEIVRAHEVGAGSGGYGLMIATWGAGGLIGAQVAGQLLGRRWSGRLLIIGALGLVAGFLIVAASPWLSVLLVGLAAGGLAEGLAEVVHLVVIQQRTPDQILSRVFATRSAIDQLAFSLPPIYAGVLVTKIGATTVYVVAAAICALGVGALAAVVVHNRKVRNSSLVNDLL
jgi:MFS family permease